MSPHDYVAARASGADRIMIHERPYLPHVHVHVSLSDQDGNNNNNNASSEQSFRQVVSAMFEIPVDSSWKVEKVSGGVTNKLFRVILKDEDEEDEPESLSEHKQDNMPPPTSPPPSVLVRVFGAHGMIDRDIENATYAELAQQGMAPPYYGRFGNGRLEGWCHGMRALVVEELSLPLIRRGIAAEMARLHSTFHADSLVEWHPKDKPSLWTQLDDWCAQALQVELEHRREQLASLHLSTMPSELDWLREITPLNADVAFCHNDVLASNVLYNDDNGSIQLIDFEYGGINYAAFDIANHWNEYASGPPLTAVPNYAWFPSDQDQFEFVTHYLQHLQRGNNSNGGTIPQDQAFQFMKDVKPFVLANHLYWGLWAVNQAATEGCEEYDYLRYAQSRLEQYKVCKKGFLAAGQEK